MSYTTTYQQGYQPYSPYRQTPQEYAEFKQYFRPIHKHICYSKIKDNLYQLQTTRDINLITQILTEFKFLTKQQSSLKEWMDKQRKHNQENQTFFQRILSNILSPDSLVLKYLGFKEKNMRNQYMSSKSKDSFSALKLLYKNYNEFVCQTIGLMAKYVLISQENSQISKIQICYSQDSQCHKYTKHQVVYLMCLMGLNLVPNQYYHKSHKYSKWFNFNNNFSYIFNNQELKAQVILTYFAEFSDLNKLNFKISHEQNKNKNYNRNNKQIYENSRKNQNWNNKTSKNNIFSNQHPNQYQQYPVKQNFQDESFKLFTIQRKCATKRQIDTILDTQINMGSYIFINDNQTMESYIQENKQDPQKYNQKRQSSNLYPKQKKQKVKVDFANKYISGGALVGGMVQQEIIYMCHPQLFVTVIICQSMNHNQSLSYSGFPKYFKNYGYGKNIKNYQKQSPNIQLIPSYILAIDAEDYSNGGLNQFSKVSVDRQILKAYSGFSNTNKNAQIVTGNWGCGVFKGNHQLKFMIQWIAGSLAGKQMVHCPYNQEREIFLQLNKKEFMQKMSRKRINEVIRMVYKGIQIASRRRDELIYVLDDLLNEQIKRQSRNSIQNNKLKQVNNKSQQYKDNDQEYNRIDKVYRQSIQKDKNRIQQQVDYFKNRQRNNQVKQSNIRRSNNNNEQNNNYYYEQTNIKSYQQLYNNKNIQYKNKNNKNQYSSSIISKQNNNLLNNNQLNNNILNNKNKIKQQQNMLLSSKSNKYKSNYLQTSSNTKVNPISYNNYYYK